MAVASPQGQTRAEPGLLLVALRILVLLTPPLFPTIFFRGLMTRVSPTVLLFLLAVLMGLPGCGSDNGATGATASLSWDPGHTDPNVIYTVHYGKRPTGESGSCNYEHAVDVTNPFVTIAGLDFSAHYYFSVSAYDPNSGARSICSDEVSKLTPEQELRIGDPQPAPEQPLRIGDPPVTL